MQTAPKTNRAQMVVEAWRPSPMDFAGLVTGGTIGAYVAGPVGALGGMLLGAAVFHLAERAIDRSSQPPSGSQPPADGQETAV